MSRRWTKPLTKAQRSLLIHLAAGGRFFAALRMSNDFMGDDVLFSESVGVIVHPPGAGDNPRLRYKVRNKTAAPLYLGNPSLVTKTFDESSGFSEYTITPAGRAALATKQESPADERARRGS